MNSSESQDLLTLQQVANRLGYTVSGVRGLIARGQLVAVKHGAVRGVRVRSSDLDLYLSGLTRYEGPASLRRRRRGLPDHNTGDSAD
jgi:excisionase family DNA binding protein